MTTFPEDDPRTFREVAMVLRQLRGQIQDVNTRLDNIRNLVITGLASPILVGVVLGLLFK